MTSFSNNPHGWNASIAGNLSPWLGVVADFGGQYRKTIVLFPGEAESRLHSALVGPRFSWRKERFTPFAHALFGIVDGHFDQRFETLRFEGGETAFGTAVGGGLDIKLSDQIAVRAFQVDYFRDRSRGFSTNKVRVGVGIVFRFGGR